MNVIVSYNHRDCPGRNRFDDRPETTLLAVHYQIGMLLWNDGDATVAVDHLDEDAHSASLEEAVVCKLFLG